MVDGKYVNYGAIGKEVEVIKLKDIDYEVMVGEEFSLPEAVEAVYNDTSCTDPIAVVWDEAQVAAVDTSTTGTYTVKGTDADGTHEVTATIKVANVNYVKNPSFEDADVSMWNVTYEGSNPTDIQNKSEDAMSGVNAFHFFSDSQDVVFQVEQTLTGIPAGTYAATTNIQGGDVGDNAEVKFYVIVDGSTDVVIGVSVSCAKNGWGTIDDFNVYSMH